MPSLRRITTAVALVTGVALALPAAASVRQSVPQARVQKLMQPKPAWYTPELHARVMAAGARGVPLPSGVAVPTSGLAFTGIRPGSWMIAPAGCTMNFVFGSPGSYSIGTAGHCTEKVGEAVTLVVVGPTKPTPLLVNIGTTKRTTGDGGVGNDFALVSIRPELQSWVSPSMAHWGGPTGAYTGTQRNPLVHSGHGLVVGTGGTPRAAYSLYVESNAVYWAGVTVFGDSGSAINTASGLAQANITHLVVDLKRPGADSAGTRITKILQLAGAPLATCAKAIPWPLTGCP